MKASNMSSDRFRPSTDVQEIFKQLEAFCETQKRKELHKGIRYLTANFPRTPKVLNRCLDWYWRTGMLTEGLKLAAPSFDEISKRRKLDQVHALGTERALFYLVFLANQSGLPWVRRWLLKEEHLLAKHPKDHLLIANLWSACRDFDRAEINLKKYQEAMRSAPDADQIAMSRMIPMILGYIHYQRGEFTHALSAYKNGLNTIDPNDSPITHLDATLMALLCRARVTPPPPQVELNEILKDFDSALSEFPHLKDSAPRLNVAFQIRKAVLQAILGQPEKAQRLITEADRLITDSLSDYSPYRRVSLLRELAPFGVLTSDQWQTLLTYPDAPALPGELSELASKLIPKKSESPLDDARDLPDHHLRISPQASEYQIGAHRFHFGIPKEIELLALIRRSHPLGIHRNLAMALLWPDQGTLIRELESRLAQLIQRLRKLHGFAIRVDRECLSLSEEDAQKITVDLDSNRPLALKLVPITELNTEWVSKTYQIGLTQARKVLKDWVERGWVRIEGKGAHTRYLLT